MPPTVQPTQVLTTTTLTITTTDTSLNGYDYQCVVSSTGAAADATSNTATLHGERGRR